MFNRTENIRLKFLYCKIVCLIVRLNTTFILIDEEDILHLNTIIFKKANITLIYFNS